MGDIVADDCAALQAKALKLEAALKAHHEPPRPKKFTCRVCGMEVKK
jgi:hypothetical protein